MVLLNIHNMFCIRSIKENKFLFVHVHAYLEAHYYLRAILGISVTWVLEGNLKLNSSMSFFVLCWCHSINLDF